MDWQGTQIDLEPALEIARSRYNPRTKKIAREFDLQSDFLGVCGEMAFAVWSGLPMIDSHGSDHGVDFVWHGFTIDVKSTTHESGRLIYNYMNKFTSDVYVLAITPKDAPKRSKVVGWAWKADLMKGEPMGWRGLPPAYTLRQSQLHPMSELETQLIMENARMSLKKPADVELEEPTIQSLEAEKQLRKTRLTEVPHGQNKGLETITEEEDSPEEA